MCTSDLLLSDDWLTSLFDADTVWVTPLDFRLTAISHFRSLRIYCTRAMPLLDDIVAGFSEQKLITTKVISSSSFIWQVNVLHDKLQAMMKGTIRSTRTSQFLSAIIAHSNIHSVLHTNAFRFSQAGSNIYTTIVNAYPVHSNTSLHNVSDLRSINHLSLIDRSLFRTGRKIFLSVIQSTMSPILLLSIHGLEIIDHIGKG